MNTFSSDAAFAEISKMMKQFEQLEQKLIASDNYNIGSSSMKMQRLSRTRVMLRYFFTCLIASSVSAERILPNIIVCTISSFSLARKS